MLSKGTWIEAVQVKLFIETTIWIVLGNNKLLFFGFSCTQTTSTYITKLSSLLPCSYPLVAILFNSSVKELTEYSSCTLTPLFNSSGKESTEILEAWSLSYPPHALLLPWRREAFPPLSGAGAATVSASVPCRTAEICPGLGYSAVMVRMLALHSPLWMYLFNHMLKVEDSIRMFKSIRIQMKLK